MLRRVSLLAMAALLFVAPWLPAQDLAEACSAVTSSKIGYWSEFQLDGMSADEVSSLRFAMIERPGEANTTWYEFQAETRQGQVTVQLDVPGWPFDSDQVSGVIVKMAGQPAMRMPDEMIAMMQQQMGDNPIADFAERCTASEAVGTESIEVPAGTFDAIRIRSDDDGSEAWISPDVPFGIVKAVVQEGGTLELIGYGTDATSSITEDPQPMPGMGGMN